MTITKSTNPKTLEKLLAVVKKLKAKDKEVLSFNFNGSYNRENKAESFSISWVEDEDL